MQLYLQPNQWTCLPTAFGIVIGLTPKDMFDLIGHDGSEIIWPNLKDPLRRRGFHPQECVAACLRNLVCPVWLEGIPTIEVDGEEIILELEIERGLPHYLNECNGVVIVNKSEYNHAVAWDKNERICLDPEGHKSKIEDYDILGFYACF